MNKIKISLRKIEYYCHRYLIKMRKFKVSFLFRVSMFRGLIDRFHAQNVTIISLPVPVTGRRFCTVPLEYSKNIVLWADLHGCQIKGMDNNISKLFYWLMAWKLTSFPW